MNALILLPIITLFLCFFVFYKDEKNVLDTKNSLRMSFLLSLVVMGGQILISTEILSLFNAINFYAVLLWWVASFCCLLGIILKINKNNKFPNIKCNYHLASWNTVDKLFLTLLVASLLFLLLNAVLTAPNNWDGLVYHLPKVIHWIQNQNLDYYATHIDRQISFQAFAEYTILHTILLTGDDYFANAVQWLSMLGSLVAVSKIAQYLRATIRAQLLASFLLLTAPVALYQSTSIQNDLVATVWVLITFLFFFKFKEKFAWKWSIMIGLSMTMALLTKSTSYIYLLPMVIYVMFLLIKNKSLKILYAGFTISALVITLNMGYYVRNMLLYKMPIPLTDRGEVLPIDKLFDPKVALSNITKNVAFSSGMPFSKVNHFFDNVARGTHKLLEIDINDSITSFSVFEMPIGNNFYSQNTASNPLHTVLFFMMLPILYVLKGNFSKDFFLLFFMGIAGILLIMLLLKWQIFGTRFHIPFLAIISICLAIMTDKLVRKNILPIIMIFLWSLGSFHLCKDENLAFEGHKTIFNTPRNELFAHRAGDWGKRFVLLVESIEKSKCREFGLYIGLDDWEYYLWKLLRDKKLNIVMRNVNVNNITNGHL